MYLGRGRAVTGTGSPAAAPVSRGPPSQPPGAASTGQRPAWRRRHCCRPRVPYMARSRPSQPQPAAPSRPAPRSCTRESPSVRRHRAAAQDGSGRAGAGAAAHQLVTAQGGMSVMYCIRRPVGPESGGGGGHRAGTGEEKRNGKGKSLCRVL